MDTSTKTERAGVTVARDPWHALRSHTSARIALGRAGMSLPTKELLSFQADHARAIDAVYGEVDRDALARELETVGVAAVPVETRAESRATYLQRPDFGRRLNEVSRERLRAASAGTVDVLIAIVDGLSADAAQRHASPVATKLIESLRESGLTIGPVPLARYGRVALQDELGEIVNARVVVSLIGERPGLGSPDSLGAYLVYGPRIGNTDAQRNCVSNIRPEGLPYPAAVETLTWLVTNALARGVSGVALKDDRQLNAPGSLGKIAGG